MSEAPIHKKVESPWRDRLSALRNLPPVLRILWASGPAVVTWGLILRVIVAALPIVIRYHVALFVRSTPAFMKLMPWRPNDWFRTDS